MHIFLLIFLFVPLYSLEVREYVENSNAFLRCSEEKNILWFKDNKLVRGTRYNKNFLNLRRLKPDDAGIYTCKGTNNTIYNEYLITIKTIDRCISGNYGDYVNFNCPFNFNNTILVYPKNYLIYMNDWWDNNIILDGNRLKLNENSFGTFKCYLKENVYSIYHVVGEDYYEKLINLIEEPLLSMKVIDIKNLDISYEFLNNNLLKAFYDIMLRNKKKYFKRNFIEYLNIYDEYKIIDGIQKILLDNIFNKKEILVDGTFLEHLKKDNDDLTIDILKGLLKNSMNIEWIVDYIYKLNNFQYNRYIGKEYIKNAYKDIFSLPYDGEMYELNNIKYVFRTFFNNETETVINFIKKDFEKHDIKDVVKELITIRYSDKDFIDNIKKNILEKFYIDEVKSGYIEIIKEILNDKYSRNHNLDTLSQFLIDYSPKEIRSVLKPNIRNLTYFLFKNDNPEKVYNDIFPILFKSTNNRFRDIFNNGIKNYSYDPLTFYEMIKENDIIIKNFNDNLINYLLKETFIDEYYLKNIKFFINKVIDKILDSDNAIELKEEIKDNITFELFLTDKVTLIEYLA